MASGEETAITHRDKAEIMAKSFAKIHGSDNLSEEGRRRRENNEPLSRCAGKKGGSRGSNRQTIYYGRNDKGNK